MVDFMRVGPDGGPVLNFAGLSRDQSAALVQVTVKVFMDGRGEDAREVRKVTFKLASKLAAIELLGKHHALFTEKHVHEFGGIAERLAAALARTPERRENVKVPTAS
jgi:phage terminase small subunit